MTLVDRDAVIKLLSDKIDTLKGTSFVIDGRISFVLGGIAAAVEKLPVVEFPEGSMVLNPREVQVVECFAKGWDSGECLLYGPLSYKDAFDLMGRLKVDCPGVRALIESYEARLTRTSF